MFCFHEYLPWGRILETYNGNKQQWRVCKKCNKAEFRTLPWDKQTPLESINLSIEETKK